MKKIYIITLFPKIFEVFRHQTLLQRVFGQEGAVEVLSLSESSPKDFKGVDAPPYGGGEGMVIRADVLKRALERVDEEKTHVVYPCPRGPVWGHQQARHFCQRHLEEGPQNTGGALVFICGRYEGIDERFVEKYVHEFISLGDYILMGGELAVLAILESSLRFAPGVLGNRHSPQKESFEGQALEAPLYTRPREFEGATVPRALLSGHHRQVEEFRRREGLRLTKKMRPDLL